MAESAPQRGSGSKRKRSGPGKFAKYINTAAWRFEQLTSYHKIIDFLSTFGCHLQYNRSTFKSFLRSALTQRNKPDSAEDPSAAAEVGPLLSQDVEQHNVQKAFDLIPDSMIDKLHHEVRKPAPEAAEAKDQDHNAASSGDCVKLAKTVADPSPPQHLQEAVASTPDHKVVQPSS